jgi:Fe-S cluster biogenesis protein NfuA
VQVTLKMGIERALREQFGARLGAVRQVSNTTALQ